MSCGGGRTTGRLPRARAAPRRHRQRHPRWRRREYDQNRHCCCRYLDLPTDWECCDWFRTRRHWIPYVTMRDIIIEERTYLCTNGANRPPSAGLLCVRRILSTDCQRPHPLHCSIAVDTSAGVKYDTKGGATRSAVCTCPECVQKLDKGGVAKGGCHERIPCLAEASACVPLVPS